MRHLLGQLEDVGGEGREGDLPILGLEYEGDILIAARCVTVHHLPHSDSKVTRPWLTWCWYADTSLSKGCRTIEKETVSLATLLPIKKVRPDGKRKPNPMRTWPVSRLERWGTPRSRRPPPTLARVIYHILLESPGCSRSRAVGAWQSTSSYPPPPPWDPGGYSLDLPDPGDSPSAAQATSCRSATAPPASSPAPAATLSSSDRGSGRRPVSMLTSGNYS